MSEFFQTLLQSFHTIDFGMLLPVIVSIVITEALLSVDNVLVVVALARELPAHLQARARFIGIVVLGLGFRLVALFFANFIMQYTAFLIAGALYLIYLCLSHIFQSKEEERERKAHSSFWRVVLAIGLADLAFSIDNVVVACGLSTDIRLVWLGVGAGMVSMFFVSSLAAKIVAKYPKLERAAFIIVGIIGVLIILEHLVDPLISSYHEVDLHIGETAKFAVIMLIVLYTIIREELNKRKIKK